MAFIPAINTFAIMNAEYCSANPAQEAHARCEEAGAQLQHSMLHPSKLEHCRSNNRPQPLADTHIQDRNELSDVNLGIHGCGPTQAAGTYAAKGPPFVTRPLPSRSWSQTFDTSCTSATQSDFLGAGFLAAYDQTLSPWPLCVRKSLISMMVMLLNASATCASVRSLA